MLSPLAQWSIFMALLQRRKEVRIYVAILYKLQPDKRSYRDANDTLRFCAAFQQFTNTKRINCWYEILLAGGLIYDIILNSSKFLI